jgi:PAS domain S-box-containing protein
VEEFQALADGIPTLCWMAEPDGHIYWYNKGWYDYTGTVAADMQGWGWQSVHDPEVLPAVMKRWGASLSAGVPFEMTFPLRGADGVFRPFMTRVAPVRGEDGKVRRWLGVNTDVTEAAEREEALHRVADALRDSENRLQTIFDTAPVGFLIGEAPSGRLIAGNPQADAIFRQPMIFAGREERYQEHVSFHADGRRVDPREFPMARAIAGEEHPEIEVLYHHRDGTQSWMRLIGAPIKTDGLITGAIVAVLDIDRKMRAIQAFSEIRNDLERRVTEEVQAREAAQVRLVQAEKLTALGQLAGGIAHDFNNVLQAVSGGTVLIRRHADDPAAVKRFGGMVEHAARRGASVTRRLLSFARRDELRAEPVDVPVLLEGLHEILTHTLGAGVTVQLDLEPELSLALADRGQLETVLVNLATNARDAMPGGGVIIISARAEMVAHNAHPTGLSAGDYVRVAVADTGAGIDAALLARVVEPFFTTKEQGKGTGLGLPMARSFAEQSGGALSIASEPGHGTTVTLWLPVTSAATEADVQADIVTFTAGAREPRILLVDDDDMVRELLADELTD